MKLDVINFEKNEIVKSIDVNSNFLKYKSNDSVLFKYIVFHNSNKRQSTKKTKDKSEVSGGGKKPWRQKRNR